jgi:hypothetical protein
VLFRKSHQHRSLSIPFNQFASDMQAAPAKIALRSKAVAERDDCHWDIAVAEDAVGANSCEALPAVKLDPPASASFWREINSRSIRCPQAAIP